MGFLEKLEGSHIDSLMISAPGVEMGTLGRYEKSKEALKTSVASYQTSFEGGTAFINSNAVNMTTVEEDEVKPDKDPSIHK